MDQSSLNIAWINCAQKDIDRIGAPAKTMYNILYATFFILWVVPKLFHIKNL